MGFIKIDQEKALNQIATIHSNDESKKKGVFPERKLALKDIKKVLKNNKKVRHTMFSVLKTASIIKKHDQTKTYKTQITRAEFDKLNEYILNVLKMDSWGVATFEEKEIFMGDGIPYKDVIVMSKHMENETFVVKELPNMDCMLEVIKVYGDTGVACLSVSGFLRKYNFGAVPNHSLGGNIDYTKAGYKANLGFVGKHGMLITPHSGSCNRLSVVYTSIENLSDFLNNNEDYSWGAEFCAKCKKCVRTCPYDAIYEDSKMDENGHVECISNEKCGSGFAHHGCAICIAACPFTKIGYDKIKNSYFHNKEK